jgi:regulator of RNase E activity RraB
MFGLSKKYPKWFDNLPKDNKTLLQLFEVGADFDKPFAVDAYLYFSTEDNVRLAEKEVRTLEGWKTDVHMNDESGEWSLALHNDSMVLNEENMIKMRSNFEAIAQKYHGDYDGWGAQLNSVPKGK